MTRTAPTIRPGDLLDLITQIVENIPNMVFVKDATDLRFVLINKAGEELLGRRRQDLLGRNDHDFFPEEQAEFFTAKDREVLSSGEALDIPEEPIETPQGRRWLHTKKVPLLDEKGTPRYLLGISEDITERRKVEHMKDDLLSIASHELRSPVAAMVGTLTLLEARAGGTLDPASRETLELAKENGRRMLELLETCLDVGRLEEEELRLHMEDIDLSRAVESAVRLNQPFADRYEVTFRLGELAPGATVRADPERLVQILTNIMTNAAKFSPPGREVAVAVVPVEGGYRVVIRDEGPGIPLAFQPRVFQKFSRARTKASAPREGAGLGLRIAQQLVERMGGEIGFDSTPGAGTTFFVQFQPA
jgi:PAS domain S-box-containing protein